MSQQENQSFDEILYRAILLLISHFYYMSYFVFWWLLYEFVQYIYYRLKGWKGRHQYRLYLIVLYCLGMFLQSVHSIFIWGFYRECFDVALSTTLITVFIFECLIPFKLLEEVYEQSLYISVEFSEWPPRFVPGYEHASVQLRLARELEEELRFREFEKRLARVCARLGGKMDSEFIEAWIARDFEVIENIYLRKVHAGLNISVADYIENMVLGTYGDALRLRDLRLTALENLENYGMIVE